MSGDSKTTKTARTFVKPLVAGGIAAALTMTLYPGATTSMGGRKYPLWALVAPSAAAGVMGGEVLRDWILPNIPHQSAKQAEMEAALLGPALAGISTVAILRIAIPDLVDESILMPLVIGVGAEVGSEYIYNGWLKQMWDGKSSSSSVLRG